MKRYFVNECFYSLQGEGLRAGTANVFVRFSKCNLACNVAEHGFDCDTDFEDGTWHTLGSLLDLILTNDIGTCRAVIFTGGEPALQLDALLIGALKALGFFLAIETNGTKSLPKGLDWVCVSPKARPIAVGRADEVKCVVAADQEPNYMGVVGTLLVSPAFKGDEPDPDAIAWAIQWCETHPEWRLSVQQHKGWGIR